MTFGGMAPTVRALLRGPLVLRVILTRASLSVLEAAPECGGLQALQVFPISTCLLHMPRLTETGTTIMECPSAALGLGITILHLLPSCLTAVGQQQIVTCQLPVELSLGNTEGNFISWNSIETNQQTILAEETGTYTATVADANRGLNGTVDGFMEVAEIPGYESNAHTVSLWIRPSSTDGIQDLISKDGECGARQWLLTLQDEKYLAHVWLADHSLVVFETEEIAQTGVWTHVAQVWDGQTLQLFVNGQLAGQLPWKGRSQQEMSLFEFVVGLRKGVTSMKELVRPTM